MPFPSWIQRVIDQQQGPGYNPNTSSVLPGAQDYYNPTSEYGRMEQLRQMASQGGATAQGRTLQQGVEPDQIWDYLGTTIGRDFASGSTPTQLADLLGNYYQPDADRLGEQIPGMEEQMQQMIDAGVNMDEVFGQQKRFGDSIIDDVWGPGGAAEDMNFQSLAGTIQSGQGVRSGGHTQNQANFKNQFSRNYGNALAQNQASLYGTATQGYLGRLGSQFNQLQGARGQFNDSRDSLFSGKMGIGNYQMNQAQFLSNLAGARMNAQTAQTAAENQGGGGGFGGFLGGLAGSFLGPVGGAVGGKIGSMIFPD